MTQTDPTEPGPAIGDTAVALTDMIPGRDIERAAANVATAAGKSLIRGLAKTLGALTAEWTAKNEALAEATRSQIETQAHINAAKLLVDARRQDDLDSIDHHIKVELARRRADRLFHEMVEEQKNLESITIRSLEIIENDPDLNPDAANVELDREWLLRFANFAQRVSEAELQELWARILVSTATAQSVRISPATLLTLSVMDRWDARNFVEFCKYEKIFGRYPIPEYYFDEGVSYENLVELGLVLRDDSYIVQINSADIWVGVKWQNTLQQLSICRRSNRGREIFYSVIKGKENLNLEHEKQEEFVEAIIGGYLSRYGCVSILPTQEHGMHIVIVSNDKDGKIRVQPEELDGYRKLIDYELVVDEVVRATIKRRGDATVCFRLL